MAAGFAALRSIDRFAPRHIVFAGIAGGLRRKGVNLGDVILAETIWYYEYSKIDDGKLWPRHRDTFSADSSLVTSGKAFPNASESWKSCGRPAPVTNHSPAFKPGTIASGEKVIDDLKPLFVRTILEANSDIHAIEMEAAGACFGIKQAHAEGRAVGFAMVRGISDLPREEGLLATIRNLFVTAPPTQGMQRDAWKAYACEIAAHFLVTWIASEWWPES